MKIDKEFIEKYLLLSMDKQKDLFATLRLEEKAKLLDYLPHLHKSISYSNDTNHVNEPETHYGNKTINFFNSMEEMNEHDIRQMQNSTPIQRIKNITNIIKTAYREELQKPLTDLRLNFD